MEFIYAALCGHEADPVKGRISRWRHLETMSTQLLLIGLVFFLILQNGSMKRDIGSKSSTDFVEDLFEEKL
jgi:hypothetical protein